MELSNLCGDMPGLHQSSLLIEYREKLSILLVSHMQQLVEYFQDNFYCESEDITRLSPNEQKSKVDHILDIIVAKVGNGDVDYFTKLITFMRCTKDSQLLDIANNMSNNQQDVYHIPMVEPMQPESSPSTPPEDYVNQHVGEDYLDSAIQMTERLNHQFEIQFSVVLCIGLPETGKTSFCNLLMNKECQVPRGNACTMFIKRPNQKASDAESKWTEIDNEELAKIIDQLNSYKIRSLHSKDTKEGMIINPNEKWDMLILLDCCIPLSALCLLHRSTVTFVTYRMFGRHFSFSDSCEFLKNENDFSKFVKELLSSSCTKRHSDLNASDESGDDKTSYIAFVGLFKDSSVLNFYKKEAGVINDSIHAFKEKIHRFSDESPLSIWYLEEEDHLHLVHLTNQKEENITTIRKKLEKVIVQNTTHKISFTWILFYFKLLKLYFDSKYAFYDDAFEKIWKAECKNFDEREFKLSLNFFHQLGALFYFDDVEELKKYVFIDCLWIFEKLNYLLGDFEDDKLDLDAKKVLKCQGLLQSKLIKHIKFEGPGKMDLKTFVNLLKHLKFIAPVNNNYFIPSILDCYNGDTSIFDKYGSPQPHPLLITFSSGSLHRSFFCYLTAYMMQSKELKIKKQQPTFKDLAIFSIDIDQYICIHDKIFFLEVELYSKSNVNCHNKAFKFIEGAVKDVCNNLQLSADECKYGFLCNLCEGDHVMVAQEEGTEFHASCCNSGKLQRLSSDYAVWFQRSNSSSVHEQATEDVVEGTAVESYCNPTSTTCLTTGFGSSSLKAGNMMYSNHCSDTAQPSRRQSTVGTGTCTKTFAYVKCTDRPTLKFLNRIRKVMCSQWYDLGLELLDDQALLDSIQLQDNDVNKCATKMFKLWLERHTQATWNDLFHALYVLELHDVAGKIETAISSFTYKIEQDPHSQSWTSAQERLSLEGQQSTNKQDDTDGPGCMEPPSEESSSDYKSTNDRPKLKFLNRFRKDVCFHWYDLGLELLDDEVLLDGIQDYDVNKCTTKMFKFWLQRHTSVTWNNLLDALIQIELRDVAIKVVTTIPTFIYRNGPTYMECLSEESSSESTNGEEYSIYIPRDCPTPAPLIKQNSVDYEIMQSEENSIYIPRDCPRPAPLIKQNSVDYEIMQSNSEAIVDLPNDPGYKYDEEKQQPCSLWMHGFTEDAAPTEK